MSEDRMGASAVVRSARGVLAAVLAVLAGLLVAVGPGAGAPSPLSISPPPAAVGALGAVAAGRDHSLVIGADRVVYGTGRNHVGQLTGTGDRTTLTALTGLPAGVWGVGVAAGRNHSLVVGSNGVVYGTGDNPYGELTGTGDRATLTALTGLPAGVRGIAVAAGDLHTLVVGDDGVVYGTGYNNYGGLTGTGDRATLTALTGLPAGVRGVAVAAGWYHSLVVGDDGVVYGTGRNHVGQLTGTGDKSTLTALTGLPAGVRSVAVAAGGDHSLVVGDDGVVYGTGASNYGELTGTGARTTLTALTGLPSGVRGVGVATNGEHTLVVGDDGVVYGTGRNHLGQLTGTGDRTTLTALTGLAAGVRGVGVAAGYFHSLVVGDDGVVYGTGYNSLGQLTGAESIKSTLTALTGQPVVSVTGPQVTGEPWVGRTLTATQGTWAPAVSSITYQWRRNDTAIPGATNQSYQVTGGDWKQRLTVAVTASFPGSVPATRASTPVTALRPPLVYAARPKPRIEGTAQVGQRLRIVHLTKKGWKPDATRMKYQWLRGRTAIRGATARTYTPVKADRGKRIRVVIQATTDYYAPGQVTTAKTHRVAPG